MIILLSAAPASSFDTHIFRNTRIYRASSFIQSVKETGLFLSIASVDPVSVVRCSGSSSPRLDGPKIWSFNRSLTEVDEWTISETPNISRSVRPCTSVMYRYGAYHVVMVRYPEQV